MCPAREFADGKARMPCLTGGAESFSRQSAILWWLAGLLDRLKFDVPMAQGGMGHIVPPSLAADTHGLPGLYAVSRPTPSDARPAARTIAPA
jgi:hypothetical protein